MAARLPGFKGEYLWELDIAEFQLLALAEAFPADRYGWRPEGARSVSEVLVHIAAGNFLLLDWAGVHPATDLYGQQEGGSAERIYAMIAVNEQLEKKLTEKEEALAILRRSLEAVRESFTRASDQDLERLGEFFGEQTTVRRVWLRILAHMHEHMGQLIAYTRAMGLPAPWPDWREESKKIIEQGRSS